MDLQSPSWLSITHSSWLSQLQPRLTSLESNKSSGSQFFPFVQTQFVGQMGTVHGHPSLSVGFYAEKPAYMPEETSRRRRISELYQVYFFVAYLKKMSMIYV